MRNYDIKLGFTCNNNCVHCVVSQSLKYGDLTFEQIKKTIENIPKESSITLTGGEPTIRDDFLDIVELCKDHQIRLQTNGTGLTEEICQVLAKYNIQVLFTMHSVDRDTYNKVACGAEDSYDKAIQALDNLNKYDIEYLFQIVVHKLNINTVITTFRYVKQLNKNIQLKLTYPDPAGNADNKSLLCSYTELEKLLDCVTREFSRSISFEGFPLCIIKEHGKSIMNAQKRCESLGLDFKDNLSFVEYNMAARRTHVNKCDECIIKGKCHGIYKKYIEYFGDSEIAPISQQLLESYKSNGNQTFMYSNIFLWVFLTRKCNRNCEYCKQGDPLNYDESMSEDNLRYILDECIKLYEQKIVRRFSFEISGGEPFLAFDTFSKVIPEYYDKYKHIFKFSSASNGTIINDEIISFFKKYYRGACISLDSLQYSKPLNGISSSPLQIENIAKLNNEGVKVSTISVFHSQSVDEMLKLAEYAVKNLIHWRILLAKPLSIMKDKILEMAKPVLKYLYENDYAPDSFDFDGWNLWTKKNVAGCPCGRTLFGIMPDLEVIPNNGEEIIKLGKFSADDFLDIVNNPLNDYYRKDVRPDICNDCELKSECDGGCRANHKNPEMLKERCDAIKELFEYVQALKK